MSSPKDIEVVSSGGGNGAASSSRFSALFLLGVAAFVWLGMDSIRSNFIVLDEYAHVPAGLSYLQLGTFRLYRESPPLIQVMAALPVLVSKAETDYHRAGAGRSELRVGYDFLQRNAGVVRTLFDRSRYVILAMGLATGLLIYPWAGEIRGDRAATLCALLWLLDPNVIAFSSVVTCDVGAAAFGTFATYAFWRFLRSPRWPWLSVSGVSLGLAQGAKTSLLAAYPAMFLCAGLVLLVCRAELPPRFGRRLFLGLALIFGMSVAVLNALYLFDGSFAPLGTYRFRSQALSGCKTVSVQDVQTGNRFRGTWLESFPVPVPKDYLLGLDSQKWDSEVGLVNLENGKLVLGGHWYSPLRTLLYKLPVGTLALLAMTVFNLLRRQLSLVTLVVAAAALSHLALLAMETGLNWPLRYSLVVLPLAFVAAADTLRMLSDTRWGTALLVVCFGFNCLEILREYPSFLSFGNLLAGGSTGAQRLFLGSCFDWGQDLHKLAAWQKVNADRSPLVVSYYGAVEPEYVGLSAKTLPPSFFREYRALVHSVAETPRTFYWAVSSNLINGMSGVFHLHDGRGVVARIESGALDPRKALNRIGSTIFVFRVEPDGVASTGPHISRGHLRGVLVPFEETGLGQDASP